MRAGVFKKMSPAFAQIWGSHAPARRVGMTETMAIFGSSLSDESSNLFIIYFNIYLFRLHSRPYSASDA